LRAEHATWCVFRTRAWKSVLKGDATLAHSLLVHSDFAFYTLRHGMRDSGSGAYGCERMQPAEPTPRNTGAVAPQVLCSYGTRASRAEVTRRFAEGRGSACCRPCRRLRVVCEGANALCNLNTRASHVRASAERVLLVPKVHRAQQPPANHGRVNVVAARVTTCREGIGKQRRRTLALLPLSRRTVRPTALV